MSVNYGNEVLGDTAALVHDKALCIVIVVPYYCEVDSITYGGKGLCDLFGGQGKLAIWRSNKTLVPNSLIAAHYGSGFGDDIEWRGGGAYSPKPILIPGNYYIGLMINYTQCGAAAKTAGGTSPYFDCDYDNPGNLSGGGGTSGTVSAYMTVTLTGPPIKIEGITPGSIEEVDWTEVAEVK